MYTARLFSRVDRLICTQIFTWTGSSPINHTWRQKTRDTRLHDGKDRIPLRSLVLTQYQSVTDGRTDGFAVAYTVLATLCFVERCKTSHSLSQTNVFLTSMAPLLHLSQPLPIVKTLLAWPLRQTCRLITARLDMSRVRMTGRDNAICKCLACAQSKLTNGQLSLPHESRQRRQTLMCRKTWADHS